MAASGSGGSYVLVGLVLAGAAVIQFRSTVEVYTPGVIRFNAAMLALAAAVIAVSWLR